jgi:hypothetical protein
MTKTHKTHDEDTQDTRRRQTKQQQKTEHRKLKRWQQQNSGHFYTIHKNTIRHDPCYKQLEVKTNRTSFVCGNRNGHHNTELRSKDT